MSTVFQELLKALRTPDGAAVNDTKLTRWLRGLPADERPIAAALLLAATGQPVTPTRACTLMGLSDNYFSPTKDPSEDRRTSLEKVRAELERRNPGNATDLQAIINERDATIADLRSQLATRDHVAGLVSRYLAALHETAISVIAEEMINHDANDTPRSKATSRGHLRIVASTGEILPPGHTDTEMQEWFDMWDAETDATDTEEEF